MHELITGGAGFIGSHLADALVARGHEVTVLDDLSTGRAENLEQAMASGSLRLVEGSILDADALDECMARADRCFHLASAVGVKLILDRPLDALTRNARGTEVVAEAAVRHGRRLVFTSSSEIYGKNSTGPLREDSDRVLGSLATSRWSYSSAKALGESLLNAHVGENGLEMVIVRLFNTVGARQSPAYGMVLPRLARQAVAGTPLTVFGDGSQTRCFTHVADTVDALTELADAENALGGTFNIGSTQEISIAALAQEVVERAGSSSSIEFVPYDRAYPEGFEELGNRRPDLSLIRSTVGWEPKRSLSEMIDDAIAQAREPEMIADAPVQLD
jgi:UDP-glucose 4-epimerase